MTFTDFFFFGNAFLLGLRHGIDWDHIAAILDIVSSTDTIQPLHEPMSRSHNSFILSLYYATGHGLIVTILGIAAICFSASLPPWTDPIMERIVGITLLILGFWVFYSFLLHIRNKKQFQLRSRWMLIFSAINHAIASLPIARQAAPAKSPVKQYGRSAAFTVGAIHGIGAETGTQVLLLGAVSNANPATGTMMLLFFVSGIFISNTLVALMGLAGLVSATSIKPAYIALGIFTGIFSLAIGSFFTFGHGNRLPALQKMLGA